MAVGQIAGILRQIRCTVSDLFRYIERALIYIEKQGQRLWLWLLSVSIGSWFIYLFLLL